jgi:hypothetical protein
MFLAFIYSLRKVYDKLGRDAGFVKRVYSFVKVHGCVTDFENICLERRIRNAVNISLHVLC